RLLPARRDRRCRGARSSERAAPSAGRHPPRGLAHRSAGGRVTEYASNDAVRLAYEVHGDWEPLLFVQGLGYDRNGFGPLPKLLAEDFRVVVFDNRGVGDSDVPEGPYSVRQLATPSTDPPARRCPRRRRVRTR